jgi:flavin reductase (DIM6/NTAB) family NADH-FMN oxidoreductase RutF
VSIALHVAARHLQAFIGAGAFAVNVLRADQHHLANLFARPAEVAWQDVDFRIAPSGHLVLNGAVAWFLCQLSARHPVGDHLLLVGAVDDFGYEALAEPLAFARGRFGAFQVLAHTLPPDFIDHSYSPAMGWG